MGARTGRNNNVALVCNLYGWRRPMFIDAMTNGYRISTGYDSSKSKDVADIKKMVEDIEKKLSMKVTARVRRGYGDRSGKYDLIIPFADANDTPIDFERK